MSATSCRDCWSCHSWRWLPWVSPRPSRYGDRVAGKCGGRSPWLGAAPVGATAVTHLWDHVAVRDLRGLHLAQLDQAVCTDG